MSSAPDYSGPCRTRDGAGMLFGEPQTTWPHVCYFTDSIAPAVARID
jgi:hypothetical protein